MGNTDIIVSVQWDIGLYTCTTGAFLANTRYRCELSDPLFCSGIKSDFWVSYYDNDASWLILDGIAFEDETVTKYAFNDTLCRKDSGAFNFSNIGWNFFGTSTTHCPEPVLAAKDYLLVTEVKFTTSLPESPLVTWFPPITMFKYPNNGSNAEVVEVLMGVHICDLIILAHSENSTAGNALSCCMYIYRY